MKLRYYVIVIFEKKSEKRMYSLWLRVSLNHKTSNSKIIIICIFAGVRRGNPSRPLSAAEAKKEEVQYSLSQNDRAASCHASKYLTNNIMSAWLSGMLFRLTFLQKIF